MSVECKVLTKDDAEDVLDVFNARKNMPMMLNSNIKIVDHTEVLTNTASGFWDHRVVVGLYEDNKLQCFSINTIIWELDFLGNNKIYTKNLVSRPDPNQHKQEHGLPIRMYNCLNYNFAVMENRGYYQMLDLISDDPKWKMYCVDPKHRTAAYRKMTVANLLPGQTFQNNVLYQKYLTSRPYDIPLKVVYRWLPEKIKPGMINGQNVD